MFLLGNRLSDLRVGDLLADGGRLHLLQGTHDAVLLASVGLNQRIHAVGVEHDVVGCDQQHPTHRALGNGEVNRYEPPRVQIRRYMLNFSVTGCFGDHRAERSSRHTRSL